MPLLSKVAQAVRETGKPLSCWSLLIYGSPKTGKSRLAATIAKVPFIKRVFYFDLENGSETLVTMVNEGILTEEEAAKIILIRIPDTKELPMAMETMLKVFTKRRDKDGKLVDHVICDVHGKVQCVACADKNEQGMAVKFNGTHFNIGECGEEDVIIVDSGTQLSNSIMNYYLLGKSVDYKPGWDEYGPQGLVLTDILMIVQNSRTNFIVLTHEVVATKIENDKEIDKYYPSIGSKNFSLSCAKYFSHVAYLEMKLGLHKGGTQTNYRNDVITGSRSGWRLEATRELDLSLLFEQLKAKPSSVVKLK